MKRHTHRPPKAQAIDHPLRDRTNLSPEDKPEASAKNKTVFEADLEADLEADIISLENNRESVSPDSAQTISPDALWLEVEGSLQAPSTASAQATDNLPESLQELPVRLSIEALTERDAVVDGTPPALDQNIVDDVAAAAGLKVANGHPLRTLQMMQFRDEHRWELEPESSEDFQP